jgi:hypothetical protein
MEAIQLAEAVIGLVNAGGYALADWDFGDGPDLPPGHNRNKWGLFRFSGNDHSPRDLYYGMGLLSKYMRGPSVVYSVTSSDARVRVSAMSQTATDVWTITAVNRHGAATPASFSISGGSGAAPTQLRKYVYDPAHVPLESNGYLQAHSAVVTISAGRFTDSIPAGSLVVYTNSPDLTSRDRSR